MRIIISLDTEDFISSQALDAQKWWAETLSEYSIRSSFQCVGELVRKWKREKRYDIIDAVGKHEIGYHTNFHSIHPVHPEGIADLSFKDALAWLRQREESGVEAIKETFNTMPATYCPPGDSWTPETVITMASMGIKIFADAPFISFTDKPFWYCGMLLVHYQMTFDSFYTSETPEEDFKSQFNTLSRDIGDDGVFVIFTHPTMLYSENFWDKPVAGGKTIDMDKIPSSPMRTPQKIERNKIFVRNILKWLKGNPDNTFAVHADLINSIPAAERYDLPVLMKSRGLNPGEEDQLLHSTTDSETFLSAAAVDDFSYQWSICSKTLNTDRIFADAKKLLWTSRKFIAE